MRKYDAGKKCQENPSALLNVFPASQDNHAYVEALQYVQVQPVPVADPAVLYGGRNHAAYDIIDEIREGRENGTVGARIIELVRGIRIPGQGKSYMTSKINPVGSMPPVPHYVAEETPAGDKERDEHDENIRAEEKQEHV